MAFKDYKELWWILGVFVGLGLIWFLMGGPEKSDTESPFFLPSSKSDAKAEGDSNSGHEVSDKPVAYNPPALTPYLPQSVIGVGGRSYEASPWYGLVTISRGTAASSQTADEEYIILTAGRSVTKPISITGWILQNGRDRILVETRSGNVRPGSPTAASIGEGVAVFLNRANQATHPIVLSSRDRAVVTTGYPSPGGNANLQTNFRLNKCMGYLAEGLRSDDRGFFSFLRSSSCPRPADEPGVDVLPDSCYQYVRSLPACHTPTTREMREARLSEYCREYIRDHFNYEACLANHSQDSDFLRPEWRVYLRHNTELWRDSREVITLYDAQGRLVHQISY